MDDGDNHPQLLSLTAKIVAAHAGSNKLVTSELAALIGSVFEALRTAGAVAVEQPVEALVPAVPIRKSVTPEFIVCLEDGKKLKMLKRYLATRFNLTPDEYRKRWGLAKTTRWWPRPMRHSVRSWPGAAGSAAGRSTRRLSLSRNPSR
jgi:predicted transcriptional regulator